MKTQGFFLVTDPRFPGGTVGGLGAERDGRLVRLGIQSHLMEEVFLSGDILEVKLLVGHARNRNTG